MKTNIIQVKSYKFALKIVKTCRILQKEKEYILSKQLLRSGTSIGANIEEAIGGQSRKDFYSKLYISYKEARETKYWIRLMADSKLLNSTDSMTLLTDIEELLKILGSILNTIKSNS